MIHYTCDRCKRTIDPTSEVRFIVEIDVRLAGSVDPIQEEHDEIDQLAELHDQLERELTGSLEPASEAGIQPVAGSLRETLDDGPDQYDLCEECYDIFSANPLGKEPYLDLNFSKN